ACLRNWHTQGGDGEARATGNVVVQELARVHAVDVVRAKDHDVVRALVVDQVQVLKNGVRGAGEPARAAPHLGRHGGHVVAEHRVQPPRLCDVAVQAMALVLGQDDDLEVAAVDQVGQGEVDETVRAAEGHGRLGAVGGEWVQTFALA